MTGRNELGRGTKLQMSINTSSLHMNERFLSPGAVHPFLRSLTLASVQVLTVICCHKVRRKEDLAKRCFVCRLSQEEHVSASVRKQLQQQSLPLLTVLSTFKLDIVRYILYLCSRVCFVRMYKYTGYIIEILFANILLQVHASYEKQVFIEKILEEAKPLGKHVKFLWSVC